MSAPSKVSSVYPVTIHVVTTAAGAATAYSAEYLSGEILAVSYVKTDFADGVDFDITTETTAQEIWDKDNVNAAETVYPRVATVDSNSVASLYAGAGEPVEDKIVLMGERIKVVVAAGGDTKTGKFIIAVKR